MSAKLLNNTTAAKLLVCGVSHRVTEVMTQHGYKPKAHYNYKNAECPLWDEIDVLTAAAKRRDNGITPRAERAKHTDEAEATLDSVFESSENARIDNEANFKALNDKLDRLLAMWEAKQ